MTTQVDEQTQAQTQAQVQHADPGQDQEASPEQLMQERIERGGPAALYSIILEWFSEYSVQSNDFDLKRWLSKRITRHLKTDEAALRKALQAIASLHHPLNVFLWGDALTARRALCDSEYVGCGFIFYPAKTEQGLALLSPKHEYMPAANDLGYPIVARVVPGSPADRANFRPGDVVISIAGRSTRRRSIDDLSRQIDSCPGVVVPVRRVSDKQPVLIVQGSTPVSVTNARYGNIGYIRISTFLPKDLPSQAQTAMEEFDDCEAIVLDIRGSPGGRAVLNLQVLSLFLECGECFTVTNDSDKPFMSKYLVQAEDVAVELFGWDTQVLPRLPYLLRQRPLYILVDGNTRSAPEGLSQSLRDHKVATIVGSPTFGKGVVQGKLSVLDYAELEALYGRWTSPQGTWIGDGGVTVESGIVPDVTVPPTAGVLFGATGDRVLETALELATKQLADKHK